MTPRLSLAHGLAALLVVAPLADALDNGLAIRPQRGYNSWYDVLMQPSEDLVLATAAAMRDKGLTALGYEYVNLDDGMVTTARAANGSLVPDPKFPHGFAWLSSQLHAEGLKFGVCVRDWYTDRGTQTCGGRAGALGHEVIDAMTYASWGVDYVKEDSCNAVQDHPTAFREYAAMRDALNATGRQMYFSLCGWEEWYGPVGPALGNSFRIGPDDTNWAGILANVDIMSRLSEWSGPGAINDPCLLLGANAKGEEAVTELQSRAQFSLWATLRAPLLLSQTIVNMSAHRLETYTNPEVLAISADPKGRQGVRLAGSDLSRPGTPRSGTYRNRAAVDAPAVAADGMKLVMAPCGSPPPALQQWHWNVPAAGFMTNAGTGLCANVDDCGTGLITYACVTSGGTCCGGTCYDNQIFSIHPDGTLRSALSPNLAATDPGFGGELSLQAVVAGSAAQNFTYDAATSTIRGGLGGAQACVTPGAINATNVWGRPLADGSWALTFVNAGDLPSDITCSLANGCLAATGWEAGQMLHLRDLWARAPIANVTATVGYTATAVPASGGVVMLRATPLFA